ncbi:MAG: PAS domain S-box protein [Desulfomonilaceae bacterium]|jgi:PAS domain S-box-containing protein
MIDRVRVLLVEDNIGDADLAQEYLSHAHQTGFDVLSVTRLAAALELLERERIDVILLDLGLPDSAGLETLSRILKAAPTGATVVLTGLDDHHTGLGAIRMGAQDYLPKGDLTPDLLIRTVLYSAERKRWQDELRQSEERFAKSFRNNPAFLTIVHMGTNTVLEVNDAWTRVFGYRRDEAIGRTTVELGIYDAETYSKIMEEVRDKGSVRNVEATVRNRTGENRVVLVSREVIEIGGEPYLLAMGLDITDRNRVENALQESEQKYRATFDTASIGIDLVDRHGNFMEVNSTLSQFLGYTPDELRRLTIMDVTHPEDALSSREMHEAIVRGETDGYRLEKRYVRKDGESVWADTAVSVIRDADGRYKATVGAIRDITQHKKSEQARIRLEAAVEQSVETVEITDAQGTIVYVNPSFETTTGYSREEAMGNTPRIVKSGHHNEEFYKRLWDTITNGKIWTGHIINRKKDGSLFEEDVSISPVKDHLGKIVNFVAVKRDVTNEVSLQRQLQQAQKMEAIGTLAGGIAHDFNNILQVALGYSDLIIGDEGFPQRYKADVQKISEAANRGAHLVQRLLTFSRKTEFKPQPLNLNHRVVDLRKMLDRTIPKMIEIQTLLSEDVAAISADPTQIDQVLMNLAVNARDSMPNGGKLTFETGDVIIDEEYSRTHADIQPGRYVLVSVSDTGSGIDDETLEHIFEPFYTTKGVGKGTGLGLAMVHGIVKRHKGHISLFSRLGAGTTFRIYFPALIPEIEVADLIAAPMPRGGSETILVVEDEQMIRDLCVRFLTQAGYKVIETTNGLDALQVYRERGGEIAMVLLDLIMPEMSGMQCLEGLLALNPSVKVVVASGYVANGSVQDAVANGAKRFINKPYAVRQVLETVRAVLDSE